MAVHLPSNSFMYLLTAYDTYLSNKTSLAKYFVLDCYIETVFHGIMPNINAAKVSTARKS